MTTRALRNNNPGNIDAGADWMGLVARENMTPEQASEPRFAVFSAPKYGFRALAKVLLNYGKNDGLNTVRGIISRWAPPKENPTAAYIKAVCDGIGKEPDAVLDLSDPPILRGLCKAISIQEAGGWFFKQADLIAGVSLALRT